VVIWNYLYKRLANGMMEEDDVTDSILEHVKRRNGMACVWESIEIEELTGRTDPDGFLVEVIINGREWWIAPQNLMRVTKCKHLNPTSPLHQ
jgi:hypothetical protein